MAIARGLSFFYCCRFSLVFFDKQPGLPPPCPFCLPGLSRVFFFCLVSLSLVHFLFSQSWSFGPFPYALPSSIRFCYSMSRCSGLPVHKGVVFYLSPGFFPASFLPCLFLFPFSSERRHFLGLPLTCTCLLCLHLLSDLFRAGGFFKYEVFLCFVLDHCVTVRTVRLLSNVPFLSSMGPRPPLHLNNVHREPPQCAYCRFLPPRSFCFPVSSFSTPLNFYFFFSPPPSWLSSS